MNSVLLGLGSNMGNRVNFIREAIDALNQCPDIKVIRCSSIYETEPYGPVKQPPFLNLVVEIETSLSPEALLGVTQSIEQNLKRERLIKWGPRTIDLDILLYADKMIETEILSVPHPEITKRLFVLVPMNELNPSITLPGDNMTIAEHLRGFGMIKGVQVWKRNNGVGEYELFEN